MKNPAFGSGLGDSAAVLYGLVRAMKPHICVEIGSARGNSTCHIGKALKENGFGKLYAIDPHTRTTWNDIGSIDSLDALKENIAEFGIENHVQIIRDWSINVTPACPIDLLFIDGDHGLEGVKRDWDKFTPHLNPFGVVVFHDTLWDLNPIPQWHRADMGVPAFVESLRSQGYPVITLDKDFGVSIVQKCVGGWPLKKGE